MRPQHCNHSHQRHENKFKDKLVPATNSHRHRFSEKRRNVRRSMLGKNEVVLLSSESDSSLDNSRCTNRSKCCWKKHALKFAPLPKRPNEIDYNYFERYQQEPTNQQITSSNTCPANLLSSSRIANIKQWIEVSPFGPQKSHSVRIPNAKEIELSSSASECDLSYAQENKNSHSKILENSWNHVVDSNVFSYGSSKQHMPQSSDVSSKNILAGNYSSGRIDSNTVHQKNNSSRSDVTTFSDVIPHVDLKNNNQSPPPYLDTKDKQKDSPMAKNENMHKRSYHNIDTPMHKFIVEESACQNDNTYSDNRRTSKDQIELSSSFEGSLKHVSNIVEHNSICSQSRNTRDLRKLEERTCLEVDENKSLSFRPSTSSCDTNVNKKYQSRLDKEIQTVILESSEESSCDSPKKLSVGLQVSLTDNESCITDPVLDKSLNTQTNINCSGSEKCISNHSKTSSIEDVESINLLHSLENPNQSYIAIQHNGSPTQELNLVLSSSASDSEKKCSYVNLDEFGKINSLDGRAKPLGDYISTRHSKEKNIFGNYRFLSDEDDDERDSTPDNANIISNSEREPSGRGKYTSFEEKDDNRTTNTCTNNTNLRLSIHEESHTISTSKLDDKSYLSLIQIDECDEKGNNLIDESIQSTNDKDDQNHLDRTASQDSGFAIGKMRLIVVSENNDPQTPSKRMQDSINDKTDYTNVFSKQEESLKAENILSKKIDQNYLRNSRNTPKFPNSHKQTILLDPAPKLDSFVKDHDKCLSFLSSLSLDEPNKRYY